MVYIYIYIYRERERERESTCCGLANGSGSVPAERNSGISTPPARLAAGHRPPGERRADALLPPRAPCRIHRRGVGSVGAAVSGLAMSGLRVCWVWLCRDHRCICGWQPGVRLCASLVRRRGPCPETAAAGEVVAAAGTGVVDCRAGRLADAGAAGGGEAAALEETATAAVTDTSRYSQAACQVGQQHTSAGARAQQQQQQHQPQQQQRSFRGKTARCPPSSPSPRRCRAGAVWTCACGLRGSFFRPGSVRRRRCAAGMGWCGDRVPYGSFGRHDRGVQHAAAGGEKEAPNDPAPSKASRIEGGGSGGGDAGCCGCRSGRRRWSRGSWTQA